MKKRILVLGVAYALVSSAGAFAAETPKAISTWSCKDFLALDESYKPTAIGFAVGLNNKDKIDDSVLDIDGIEKVTPILIESCKKNTQSKFLTEFKSAWKAFKKDM